MRIAERIAPVAAAAGAVSTLLCCLPVGLAATAGGAAVAAAAARFAPWLMVLSVVLLGVTVVLVRRSNRVCGTRSWLSAGILLVSAAVVLIVLAFPQLAAALAADWLPGGRP